MLDWTVLRQWFLATILIVPAARAQAKVGQRAPEFTLATLTGDSVRIPTFGGHAVVLKFWASWCPTCQTEMPELVAAQTAHRDAGLEVLAINGEETPDKIRHYLAKLGIDSTFTVLIDPKDHVATRYRVVVLPTTLFIDSSGVVRALYAGAISSAEFAEGMRTILPTHTQE